MYEPPAIFASQSTMNIEHELGKGEASAILDVIFIRRGTGRTCRGLLPRRALRSS